MTVGDGHFLHIENRKVSKSPLNVYILAFSLKKEKTAIGNP